MNNRISTRKLKVLFMLRESENGIRPIARLLRISRNTTKKYLRDMRAFCTRELEVNPTFSNYLKKVNGNEKFQTESGEGPARSCALFELFPETVKRIEEQESTRKEQWEEYKRQNPDGYSYSFFAEKLADYCHRNGITITRKNIIRVKNISLEEMETLKKWKRSGIKWKWERATVLFDSFNGECVATLTKKVERGKKKVKSWIKGYESVGLDALLRKKPQLNEAKLLEIKKKKENLIKLLHEPPKLH
jgi:hypothetical protein